MKLIFSGFDGQHDYSWLLKKSTQVQVISKMPYQRL